ncbi:MAG TPA: hypothetical protein VNP94_10455, partial [Actinomycetota bacterium]|nr:hypothetical protein [Actinomycetota bacterium]
MPEVLPGQAPEPAQRQDQDALPGLRLTPPRRRPWPGLLAAASGALLSFSLPPAGLWPLALVSLAPLVALARRARPPRGAALGFVFGVAYFGLTLSWILLFGELAWTGLVLAQAASVAAFGAVTPVLWRDERPLGSAAGLAAAWTVLEWVRGAWPLGGFTWGQLGSSQVGNPALLPLASWGGVWALTFVAALANALLVVAADRVAAT